jgi:hypothetical protein
MVTIGKQEAAGQAIGGDGFAGCRRSVDSQHLVFVDISSHSDGAGGTVAAGSEV